jgi:hypothetical protein
MLQQKEQTEAHSVEWSCQAMSPIDETCHAAATFHCGICGRWFCADHGEEEAWHRCAIEPEDEGPEGCVVGLAASHPRFTKSSFPVHSARNSVSTFTLYKQLRDEFVTFPSEIVRTLTPSDSKFEMSSEYVSPVPNASSTCVRDDHTAREDP